MERLYGLLGWPVGHSVSPAMMTAAFAGRRVEGRYLSFGVPSEKLSDAVTGLRALGAGGVNVTIPHKQSVYQLVDTLTDEARLAGAVNTVRFEADGHMTGHNTDIAGWWQSLTGLLPNQLDQVCILGAGGAARAAIAALSLYAPNCQVSICARNPQQLETLVRELKPRLRLQLTEWAHRHEAVSSAQVVTNATSLGMWPHDGESPIEDPDCFSAGQVVQDMVYRPRQTQLLRTAVARGATVIDGLHMLVAQGAAAFTFWTGQDAPVDIMEQAAVEALSTSV